MRKAAALGELALMNEVLAKRGSLFRFPLKDRRIMITGDDARPRRLHAAPVRTHVVVMFHGGDRPAAHAVQGLDGPASNYVSILESGNRMTKEDRKIYGNREDVLR